ncbi:MAG: 30S ribosomal protein S17 [Gammaproteobacteria bacterium]|nr:30S ribosomal protein S17 [Gammaproteobacteria bacterium]
MKIKRTVQGIVSSDKMDKTIVVKIERRIKHPIGKFITRHLKIHAHDEKNIAKIGDFVEIVETSPFSKKKSWELVKVLETRTEA